MVPRTLPGPKASVRYPRDVTRSIPLARLLLADFDPEVTSVYAQPCLLAGMAGGPARRHVPDFLLGLRDGTVRVVNVKPAGRLADPKIAEALAWPGELFRARGWDYQMWPRARPGWRAESVAVICPAVPIPAGLPCARRCSPGMWRPAGLPARSSW
jgi:hypothetical protein